MPAKEAYCPLAQAQGRRLLVFTNGSRGDVQPVAALSCALQQAGFAVRVSTNVNHVQLLSDLGLDAAGTTMDSEAALWEDPGVIKAMSEGNAYQFVASMKELSDKYFPSSLEQKIKLMDAFKPDLILCASLDYYEVLAFAGARAIPVVPIRLQLGAPSRDLQTVFGEPGCCPHWAIGTLFMKVFWLGQHAAKHRTILQQLPEAEPFVAVTLQQWMYYVFHPIAPVVIGFSPTLQHVPSDWSADLKARSTMTGFWVVPSDRQETRLTCGDPMFGGSEGAALAAFVGLGGPPVYMGWGSMLCVSAGHMACLAVRTLMQAGQRGVVLGGLPGLNATKLMGQPDSEALVAYAKENVLFVKTAPHEWLFPRCRAVVHHGGSGTTAAALRSGVPSVVTPIFLDQFQHAGLVARSGAGIGTKQLSKVTAAELADAVQRCIGDQEMIHRACSLGKKLQAEDGLSSAVIAIDKFLVDEVETGIWEMNFKAQTHALRCMKAQGPPGCLAWICRLCCSSSPNEYKLAKARKTMHGNKRPTVGDGDRQTVSANAALTVCFQSNCKH